MAANATGGSGGHVIPSLIHRCYLSKKGVFYL